MIRTIGPQTQTKEDLHNVCTTLKQSVEIDRYIDLASSEGFQIRSDRAKNWDNYKAIHAIMKRHPSLDSVILDAGGISSSALLPSLQRMGYQRLVALDLCNPQPPKVQGNIVYRKGDITKTEYPDGYFNAVGCLSVIEHGVNLLLFFEEMGRIIKSGGTLIVSTDYWQTKIENKTRVQAYGVPVHIFSEKEIRDMINIASIFGFKLVNPNLDLRVSEKTVNWLGFEYTFLILGFERT